MLLLGISLVLDFKLYLFVDSLGLEVIFILFIFFLLFMKIRRILQTFSCNGTIFFFFI